MWREKFNRAVERLVRAIQKVLIVVLLTLTYVLGFAFTWIPARLARRRYQSRPGAPSFWLDVTDGPPDLDEARRQS